MSTRAVKTTLPASANGKLIKFQINSGDNVGHGTGILKMWPSPQGECMIQIEVTEGIPDGQITGTIRLIVIEINQRRSDLIKKSNAGSLHEYELIEPEFG